MQVVNTYALRNFIVLCMNMCLYINGILTIYYLSFSLRKASWGSIHVESYLCLPPGLFETEPSTMKLSCISSSPHSVPFSLRLGQHSFISMAWDSRRCHIKSQSGWGKGACPLWPRSTLWHPPTCDNPPASLQVAWGESELWEITAALQDSSLPGPILTIGDSQRLGHPEQWKGHVHWQI